MYKEKTCCCCCSETGNTTLVCPQCESEGKSVSKLTVKSIVKSGTKLEDDDYHICMNSKCDVAYYTKNTTIKTSGANVPIWFKEDAEPKILCYCSNVTQEDISNSVNALGTKEYAKVKEHAGAMKICECETKNPTGKCCANVIKEYIQTL